MGADPTENTARGAFFSAWQPRAALTGPRSRTKKALMTTQRLIWTLGWITMSSLAALQGCGDDEDDGGGGGGKGGTSGAAGEAGDGGTSGAAGSGARGGTGGSGATGGTGGATGGTGAVSGAGGAPGGAGGEGGQGEGGGGTDEQRASVCMTYCASYFSHGCDSFDDTNTYDDAADCQSTCEDSSWDIGVPAVAGPTIWCRAGHADLAVGADQELHCGHASEEPTGVCI